MSISTYAVSAGRSDFSGNAPTVAPTPTLSEQAHTLALSGHSVVQIASFLDISTAQVDSTLRITSPSSTSGTDSDAVDSRLSVHV